MVIFISTLLMVIAVFDTVCYGLAKFPERSRWFYLLPLGGYFALFILGRDLEEGF